MGLLEMRCLVSGEGWNEDSVTLYHSTQNESNCKFMNYLCNFLYNLLRSESTVDI